MVVVIRRAYEPVRSIARHPLSGPAVAALAVVAALAASPSSSTSAGAMVGLAVGVMAARSDPWPLRVVALLVLVAVGVGFRAGAERHRLEPDQLGPYIGTVKVVDEPQSYRSATRVIVEVERERFEVWERRSSMRTRVDAWRAGDRVLVSGLRSALDADRADRVGWQHVVGEFTVDWASDVGAGAPIDRASNRVRQVIERGSDVLPGDDAALFRGLVIGDDRDQPWPMIERFRASGLSHLTAVSGQNVSFLLAAAGPLLRSLRPMARWLVSVGLIVWFVSLTRFEPSIVRAGAMAVMSATGFALGRERGPARMLSWAVVVLLLVDPLLVGSVGFWLSVGATGGVVVVGPVLADRLSVFGRLAMPLGVTLGAQVGVAVPALLVFGRLPLVSVPANLLAVPVAGFVMLYGLPAGLVAGVVPAAGPVVMLPCRIGVRWVDRVAALGAEVEPGGVATWIGWGVFGVVVVGAGLVSHRSRVASGADPSGTHVLPKGPSGEVR